MKILRILLVGWLLPVAALATGMRGPRAEEAPKEISITAYEVTVQELKKPVVHIDAQGIKKRYKRAFVVRLRGHFGQPRAIPLDIFIGDWRVPEYGGTKDGIYFRIYDEKMLNKLNGQPFGYGFQGQKVKTLALRFEPSKRKPFQGEKRREDFRIRSYDIVVETFDKPVVHIDAQGRKKRYREAFVVRLQGDFGRPRAIPLDIFIGDWRVPEYGGTKEGIYFRVYDEKMLNRLEGQTFGYGFQGQRVGNLSLKFTPSKFRPFKSAGNSR